MNSLAYFTLCIVCSSLVSGLMQARAQKRKRDMIKEVMQIEM